MRIVDTDVAIEVLRGNERVIERRRQTDDRVATTWVIASADLLIAAVTLARGAVLVTGNVRHYDRIEAFGIEDWIRG